MGVELVTLRHGTIEFRRDGLPYRWMSGDTVAGELRWENAARLAWAAVMLPDGRRALVRSRVDMHPIFGPCDELCLLASGDDGTGGSVIDDDLEPGPVLSRFASVDWGRPRRVPPLERPSALPAGAGTAVLNLIATLARTAGVETLRYAGPYPTAALFAALRECFTCDADEARFTEGVEERAFAGRMEEIAVDFHPAPFERCWYAGDAGAVICAQRRDGLERAYVDGRVYTRDERGARRLVRRDDRWHCEVWIAGAPWGDVACLTDAGEPVSGPHPLPAPSSELIGVRFAPSLVAALAELAVDEASTLLAAATRELAATLPIVWGDPGDDVACLRDGAIVVHAAIAERLSGAPVATLASMLASAVAPVLARAAQASLEERWMRSAAT